MAIHFLQEQKKQEKLLLVFIGVVLIILLVIWWGFFKKSIPSSHVSVPGVESSKIEINFEVLKNSILQEFVPFDEILPLEGEVGRENPFVPY